MTGDEAAEDRRSELLDELMFSFRASDAARLVENLPATLHEAGRRSAHRALAAMNADSGYGESMLRAGMAVEYMSKWYLAEIHPMLVADGRDLPTILAMIGQSHRLGAGDASLRHAKTISGRAACQRVSMLSGQGWSYRDKEDSIVFLARNAVAHLAVEEDEETEASVASIMVRLIDELLVLSKASDESAPVRPLDDFWECYQGVVEVIRSQHHHLAGLRVAAKIESARRLHALRLPEDLPDESRSAAIRGFNSLAPTFHEPTTWRRCPACGEQGHLVYYPVNGEVFASGPAENEKWHQAQEGTPVAFTCPVCELDLEHEELAVVGLDEQLHFDSIDVDPRE